MPIHCEELPRASDLTRRVLELSQSRNFRARGRLIYTDAANRQSVYQISAVQKQLPQSTNLLWSVTDPPESRLRILIESFRSGKVSVRMAVRSEKAAVLPANRWSHAILGTNLAIGDLLEDHFLWPKQTVTGEEVLGTQKCYVLRSEPGAPYPSRYAAAISWIDETSLLPVRVLKEPLGNGPKKEALFRGLKQVGGHWIASMGEVRSVGSTGNTRFFFVQGSETAQVADSEVDPAKVFQN